MTTDLFCPHCGAPATDLTGENDWVCSKSCLGEHNPYPFIEPVGDELLRLRRRVFDLKAENAQLRKTLDEL